MKVSFKAKYETDKTEASAAATAAFNAGDFKLRASMTDATIIDGPSLKGLAFAVEKPDFFIAEYVPKKDFRFQFMNTVKVVDKPLNLTYIHHTGDNRTILEGTLVFDSSNKLWTNYKMGTKNCKLRYSYMHGVTTFEPMYDLANNSWEFAVSRKVYGNHSMKAIYQTQNKMVGLEWLINTKLNGDVKVFASVNLADKSKTPRLTAESSWSIDM